MKTSSQTIYILLERGIEDKAMLKELNKIFGELNTPNGIKTIAVKYPMLLELHERLEAEKED